MGGTPENEVDRSAAESTRGYPDGTGEYSDAPEGREPHVDGADGGGRREFWKPLGFETFRDYLSYMNRMQEQLAPLPRTATPPAPEVVELEAAPTDPPAEHLRRCQVNVKLRPHEAEDLRRAAHIYGLAPSTLARVLVNRGVARILELLG
jgi:hypothetical protein